MSINLVHTVNNAMTESITEQLAQQFGIPGHIVRQLAARTTPGLVATLMDRASLAPGARSLYSVIMLPETNAYIVDQFDKLVATTGGLKHLEANGHSLYALASGQRMDSLTDAVSAETGVPTQAASALAGIVAATLFGIIKRHFLLAQWNQAQLPMLLREQTAEIRASLSNGVAMAIGVGSMEGFTNSINARLEAVGSMLEERHDAEMIAATVASEPAVRAAGHSASSTNSAMSSAPLPPPSNPLKPLRKPVKKKSSKAWVWLLFAFLAGILGFVYYQGFTQGNTIQLFAPEASAPVATGEQTPASDAVPPMPLVTSEGVAPVAASAASAVVSSAPPAAAAASSAAPAAASASATQATATTPAPASAVLVPPLPAPTVTTITTNAANAANTSGATTGTDAKLVFNVSTAGIPAVQATVSTEAEKQQLTDALTRRFGKHYTANIAVSPDTLPATWIARLDDFLPLMSLPGAEVKVTGSKVELGGTAANAKLGWTDRLKAALGGVFEVGSFNVNNAVASATESFRGAMKSLLASDASCSGDKLTKVLDLQVVNFAKSSATVPENAYATLGETAQLLKNCAARGSMVNLEVAGYSDSIGKTSAKLELSKERAQSVRAFLVRSGVPAQTLRAAGYGDANPVADNATESGRFANRRIAFIVK